MSQRFDVRPSVLYENRYCVQNEFDIIINHQGNKSKDSTNNIKQIESADVKCNVVWIPMSANHCYAKTAAIGSDIFVLNGSDKKVRKTSCVDIRSRSTWKNLMQMPHSKGIFSFVHLWKVYI